jgi:hypothetical protein
LLRRTLHAVCLIILCALAAHAQDAKADADDKQTGLVYGKDYAFAITAPAGWVLDTESGIQQGLHAVFYPTGSSWKASQAVMYVNAAAKADTLEKFVEGDVADFRKGSPRLKVTDEEPLAVAGKQRDVAKRFVEDQLGNFESVAYVEESKVVITLVLSARTQGEFDAALPAFRKLVSSYRLISDKVVTGTK